MKKAHVEAADGRLALSGPVTQNTVNELHAALQKRLAEQTGRALAVDWSGVAEVDSTAVSLLVALAENGRRSSRTVTFHGVKPQLRSLIELYGLEWLVPAGAPQPAAPAH